MLAAALTAGVRSLGLIIHALLRMLAVAMIAQLGMAATATTGLTRTIRYLWSSRLRRPADWDAARVLIMSTAVVKSTECPFRQIQAAGYPDETVSALASPATGPPLRMRQQLGRLHFQYGRDDLERDRTGALFELADVALVHSCFVCKRLL